MTDVKANDPNNVAIIFGGVPISGYGTGDFLTIEQDEDTFGDVTGADGETIRSKGNPHPMVTVTLTLMESSTSNSILSAMHQIDRLANNGAGVVPFLYKDGAGTSIFAAEKCWVSKPPSIIKGKEGKERAWTLRAKTGVRHDGQM